MKLAIAQINTTVGDFEGNLELILKAMAQAENQGAELLLLPELALCGYPPLDLLERKAFREANRIYLERLIKHSADSNLKVLLGFAEAHEGEGQGLYNSAALLGGGHLLAIRRKSLLPTYDVFDEGRYFDPAPENSPVELNGISLGITLCEDIWNDRDFWPSRRYPCDPVESLVKAGAQVILNLSASPYHIGKPHLRREMIQAQAQRHGVPLAYCNLVGGNDELIFEGGSMLVDAQGRIVCSGARFQEELILSDLFAQAELSPEFPSEMEDIERALLLGLRDYCRKCGFSKVVLGLSGGIDSALVAALAVKALGAENVVGIGMPSRYSSEGSVIDAQALAENLGMEFHVVPIEGPFAASLQVLQPLFEGTGSGVTEENIQARLRGMILMAYSNKFGGLLLTTGNKSELAVGYCTLYGDMSGGLALISDLPKMQVYALSHFFNRARILIPESTLSKPPSAELAPDQLDEDSLPPYPILDDLLARYVEQGETRAEIIAAGHDPQQVEEVLRRVDRNEYKRRQAAPGLKVSSKAFGMGRRIPIAQHFSG